MNEPDQGVLNALNFLLQKSREKERTMTKPNTPTAALPSLLEVLIERHKKTMTKPSNDSYFERYSSSNY